MTQPFWVSEPAPRQPVRSLGRVMVSSSLARNRSPSVGWRRARSPRVRGPRRSTDAVKTPEPPHAPAQRSSHGLASERSEELDVGVPVVTAWGTAPGFPARDGRLGDRESLADFALGDSGTLAK